MCECVCVSKCESNERQQELRFTDHFGMCTVRGRSWCCRWRESGEDESEGF